MITGKEFQEQEQKRIDARMRLEERVYSMASGGYETNDYLRIITQLLLEILNQLERKGG